MERLPSGSDAAEEQSTENRNKLVVHGDLHYTPNDIAELRKLADDHPELAKQIVEDKRLQSVISHNTERLGMAMAAIFGVVLIAGASYTLVRLGWWQSTMFVGALLGISHVLRTLLKGEFSDTSWFGKILTSSPRNKPKDSDEENP